MKEGAIVLPVRAVAVAGAALAAAIAIVVIAVQPVTRDAILRLTDPRTTAAAATIEQQRTATEHALQRGYVKATGQLAEVRKLTLAIPATQAQAIDDRAHADLRAIRHDALAAIGSRLGVASSALEAYVTAAETQLGDNAFAEDKPVLLAPDLYGVVARANDLFQRSADAATRELTRSPSAAPPIVTPTPRPSPSGSPSPTPSASPTGR